MPAKYVRGLTSEKQQDKQQEPSLVSFNCSAKDKHIKLACFEMDRMSISLTKHYDISEVETVLIVKMDVKGSTPIYTDNDKKKKLFLNVCESICFHADAF